MSDYAQFEDMGSDVIAAAEATASLWLRQAAKDYEPRSVLVSLTRLILGVRKESIRQADDVRLHMAQTYIAARLEVYRERGWSFGDKLGMEDLWGILR